jgi:hypothetical protein
MTILHDPTSSPRQCLPTLRPPLVTGIPASGAAAATSPAQGTVTPSYQEEVAKLLGQVQPITQSTMEVGGWRALDNLLTCNVLQAAATAGRDWYMRCFKSAGLVFASLTPRPVKKRQRVLKKIEEAKRNKQNHDERVDTEFKPHSDLCAFVVREKDPSKILPTAKRIVEAVEACGGGGYVRSRWGSVPGPDIVEYVFLYHKDAGFIAEVQVAHPFAAYTFHLDSAQRDMKNAGRTEEAEGMLDLWKNSFYEDVKAQLLSNPGDLVRIRDLYDSFVAHLRTAPAPSARPDDPGLPRVLTELGL